MSEPKKWSGACACGQARYQLTREPMATHACHCVDCQTLSGSAFAVNLWIEEAAVELLSGELKTHMVGSGSGKGHELSWCEQCGNYLWGRYLASPPKTLFVKAGTLYDTSYVVPTAHIYTKDKQSWLQLADDIPKFETFYSLKEVWSQDSRARLRALLDT